MSASANPSHNQSPMPSVPSGFGHLLNPVTPKPSVPNRLHLLIRQQPLAARTCASGEKSRRCIDPSPIVQLVITDFDKDSEQDIGMLRNSQYVVACQLFAAPKSQKCPEPPGEDENKAMYGKTYVSPFFVEADPEPAKGTRFIGSCQEKVLSGPSTFFVFADLRIPIAGTYQLRFRLIDVAESLMGGKIPFLDEVWSNPFRAYSAKDFPGMRPTSYLSEQLKSLGADGSKSRKSK